MKLENWREHILPREMLSTQYDWWTENQGD